MARKLKRVIVLSPYKGDVEQNVAYARRCMLDSMQRFEAPFASHLLYPQILNDGDPKQRALGFQCEEAWATFAELLCVYTDLGISSGMRKTMRKTKMPVVLRTLEADDESN